MTTRRERPLRLLFLIGDTGGGHRSAAKAVAQALDRACPGRFSLFVCDPLSSPYAPRRLHWIVGLYGPVIWISPWLWGILWRAYGMPDGHYVETGYRSRPGSASRRRAHASALLCGDPLACAGDSWSS